MIKVTNTQKYMTAATLKWPQKKKKKISNLDQFDWELQFGKWKKYDIDNLTHKHLLCKQFLAWSCNGSSVAPLTDYMNNLIYQELIFEDDCFDVLFWWLFWVAKECILTLELALDMSKKLKNLNEMIQKLPSTFY